LAMAVQMVKFHISQIWPGVPPSSCLLRRHWTLEIHLNLPSTQCWSGRNVHLLWKTVTVVVCLPAKLTSNATTLVRAAYSQPSFVTRMAPSFFLSRQRFTSPSRGEALFSGEGAKCAWPVIPLLTLGQSLCVTSDSTCTCSVPLYNLGTRTHKQGTGIQEGQVAYHQDQVLDAFAMCQLHLWVASLFWVLS
jgi:hypothetical protein